MSDMTNCTSEYCPVRESCHRAQMEALGRSTFNYEYTCHEKNGFCNYMKGVPP